MTLFTSQSAAAFYDKLFSSLDFSLPGAATGRRGFPKEAMVCAFIVMKCEGFTQITDLMDYLDNNRLIAHYLLRVLQNAPQLSEEDAAWAEKLLPANAPEGCYMPQKIIDRHLGEQQLRWRPFIRG